MDTTKQDTEGNNNVPAEQHDDDHAVEKASMPSHEDDNSRGSDVEAPLEGVEQHPKMTFKRFMALFSLGCLLAAAQIPIYLLGGALCTYISFPRHSDVCAAYTVADIGGETSYAWLAIANTLSLAAVAPFAGAISDLIGRRYVALLGALFVCIGMIVVGTAHRMDVAIGGMAIAGVGAGLGELVGAAGISELAPVKSRGKYIGLAFLLILPFSASAAYGSAHPPSHEM
jgi:MFS family permease